MLTPFSITAAETLPSMNEGIASEIWNIKTVAFGFG